MKKTISLLLTGFATLAFAQVSLSAKANLLFPTGKASWENIKNSTVAAYEESGKNNVGFNIGLSAKLATPTSFFIMPEVYYTTFKNEFTDPETQTTLEAKSNRVDVPVLLGYDVWGDTLGIFAGPVASYNLSTDDTFNDFRENAKNNFTVGYQFGAQVMIKSLIVNARYEGAFSKDEREFINDNVNTNGYTVRYDSRQGILLLGLGYKF